MPAAPRNNIIGKPFIELFSVDSTNNYAMRLVQKGLAEHGTACFAFEQTKGKGQRNKQWESAKGENIILSVILDTSEFPVSGQFGLGMTAALSASDLFNKYTTNTVHIKWPNDIYWGDRKAAGILIENVIRGDQWRFAVIGYGININQTAFDSSLKNPVSLKQITAKEYDVRSLAKELCSHLQNRFTELREGKKNLMLSEYNNALYKRNMMARFRAGPRNFSARVKRVDGQGRLIVGDMVEELFEFGQIEWVLD